MFNWLNTKNTGLSQIMALWITCDNITNTPFTRGSIHEANMKQMYSIYMCTMCALSLLHVSFMYASSCKRGIRQQMRTQQTSPKIVVNMKQTTYHWYKTESKNYSFIILTHYLKKSQHLTSGYTSLMREHHKKWPVSKN